MTDQALSPHFSLKEMTYSQSAVRHGIDNSPDQAALNNLKALCLNVLEPIRTLVGNKPVKVNSAYRSLRLNSLVGGSLKSEHLSGKACDFEVVGLDNLSLAKMIVASNIPFGQLILEGYDGKDPNSGWIHISFRPNEKNPRQVLTATFINGKAKYSTGLPK
jgi:hypothetical protein